MSNRRNRLPSVVLLLVSLTTGLACDDSGGSLGVGGFGQHPNQNASTIPGVVDPAAAPLIGTWSARNQSVTIVLSLEPGGEAALLMYTGIPPRYGAAEASVGTFHISGDRLVLRALKSSCPHTLDDPTSEFTFRQMGNLLHLADGEGTIVFSRTTDEVAVPDRLGCLEDATGSGTSAPPGTARG